MKIKSKIGYCTIVILIMLMITNNAYAITRYATGVGTNAFQFISGDDIITTTDIVDEAKGYWEDAGYTQAYRHIDPSYTLFASNMIGGEVIQLVSHGGISSMAFKSCVGITTGATRTLGAYQYIGLDYLRDAWRDNLLLIAYMGCETGAPGNVSNEADRYLDSITYQSVAYANAETAIGFEEEVSCADMKKWSKLFNEYLASGHGVEESAVYANNNIRWYNDESIKRWLLVYNTNSNQKIGRYHSTADLASIQESYTRNEYQSNNLLNKEVKLTLNNDNEIINQLKKIDSSMDSSDYVITRSKAHIMKATGEKENREIEFVDVNLKIGDFYTDAGYTLEIENNNIKGIYDKNINLQKQKELLNNKEELKKELYSDKVNEILNESETISTYTLNRTETEENNARYYYNIANNKKYYQVEIKDETLDIDGNSCVMYDTVSYEL